MGQICPKANICCTSDNKVTKTSILWTINNFSKCTEKSGEWLESSIFWADEDIPTKWSLILFPNGDKNSLQQFVSLFLVLNESDRIEVSAHIKLALITGKQQVYSEIEFDHTFSNKYPKYGHPKFIRRPLLEENKKRLLPNDRLTVYCEVTSFGKHETETNVYGTELIRNRILSDDMTAFYQNLKVCDLKIVVKGHKFSAHKFMLMARSPVFHAMFEHPMRESLENRVVIEDIDAKVFANVLRFIYTDKVVNEDIDSNLMLLSAADKYDIGELKCICEQYVGSQLTVESVSDVLIVADNHSAQELKSKSMAFIKSNTIEVMKTQGWKKVINRQDLLELF